MQPDAERARKLAHTSEARIVLLRYDRCQHPLAPDVHEIGHLRRLHIIGAGRLGFADQLDGGVEIGGRREARAHLHEADGEGRGCAHDPPCVMPSAASRASSSPARFSACNSSEPPTCVSPMKICGTVMRPLVRSIILPRPSELPLTSISTNGIPLRVSSALAEWQ